MTYQEAKAAADKAWRLYERNPTTANMRAYCTAQELAEKIKTEGGK